MDGGKGYWPAKVLGFSTGSGNHLAAQCLPLHCTASEAKSVVNVSTRVCRAATAACSWVMVLPDPDDCCTACMSLSRRGPMPASLPRPCSTTMLHNCIPAPGRHEHPRTVDAVNLRNNGTKTPLQQRLSQSCSRSTCSCHVLQAAP